MYRNRGKYTITIIILFMKKKAKQKKPLQEESEKNKNECIYSWTKSGEKSDYTLHVCLVAGGVHMPFGCARQPEKITHTLAHRRWL